MAKRKIIDIDADKCNGCGLCIPNCPEGAIQMIDGKARLLSDLFCDGLGACLGHCPEGAITIAEREAEPYSEARVMENIIKGGPKVIKAHLEHLKDHGELKYLKEALDFLTSKSIDVPALAEKKEAVCGCPGAAMQDFSSRESNEGELSGSRPSALRQWPVQLHLVPPNAPYFQGKDVVLSADCVAYALGDFHKDYLKNKSLAIACPKLDADQDIYIQKLVAMMDQAKINTLTVMIMEVPCCSGLLYLAKKAKEAATRQVPLKVVVVGLQGNILREEWVE